MDRRNNFEKERRKKEKEATKMFHGMRACFRVHVCMNACVVYPGVRLCVVGRAGEKKRKDSVFRIHNRKKVLIS